TSRDSAVGDRTLPQASLELSTAGSRAALGVAARLEGGGARSPLQLEGRASWSALDLLTLSVDARHASYSLDRSGDRAHLAAGLLLPLRLSARGGGDFEPPRHARSAATFYSKFWRQYKSGIFAFRVETAVESWSGAGTAAVVLDTTSGTTTALALPGATFVDFNLQIRIAGVTIFWV